MTQTQVYLRKEVKKRNTLEYQNANYYAHIGGYVNYQVLGVIVDVKTEESDGKMVFALFVAEIPKRHNVRQAVVESVDFDEEWYHGRYAQTKQEKNIKNDDRRQDGYAEIGHFCGDLFAMLVGDGIRMLQQVRESHDRGFVHFHDPVVSEEKYISHAFRKQDLYSRRIHEADNASEYAEYVHKRDTR